MNIIKIKHETSNSQETFDIEIKKLIYVLSKLENNKDLKFENQEQIEALMKKHNLLDEHFLKNINNL